MTRIRVVLALAAVAALAPARAAALSLLDAELSLDRAARPVLLVAMAAPAPTAGPSLDFDLLGEAPQVETAPDDPSLRRRRKMLTVHQALGFGLLGLQLATTTTGQLNYLDKFGTANTARYKQTHQLLSYSTLGVFAVNGAIALLAPTPKGIKRKGVDRVTIHKLGMATAAAGMLAQGALGFYTARREGYLDKQDYGTAHLAIGYATLAAVGVAVGALVL